MIHSRLSKNSRCLSRWYDVKKARSHYIYYWGNDSFEPATYSIPAGQGVVINCAEGLTITIRAPYSL